MYIPADKLNALNVFVFKPLLDKNDQINLFKGWIELI